MHANDNHPCGRSEALAGACGEAALLVEKRNALTSDAVEQLADELVEGRLGRCGRPEFAIAVIDELRRIAGAMRADETRLRS